MKCLVVEDDADTSRYISDSLGAVGFSVAATNSGAEGLQLAAGRRWDAIILDRMLPGDVDGLSILGEMRRRDITTPVLILSALSALDERLKGLREGGDDYLTKPFAITELQARLEALVRRADIRASRPVLAVGGLRLDLTARTAERDRTPIALQPREFRLLEYLVRHSGQVVTRKMLIEAIWNYKFDPHTGVIDVMVSRLRQKVDRGFDRPLIHTVRGVGYIVREEA
jgi:two-component system OmpR family response regulator